MDNAALVPAPLSPGTQAFIDFLAQANQEMLQKAANLAATNAELGRELRRVNARLRDAEREISDLKRKPIEADPASP